MPGSGRPPVPCGGGRPVRVFSVANSSSVRNQVSASRAEPKTNAKITEKNFRHDRRVQDQAPAKLRKTASRTNVNKPAVIGRAKFPTRASSAPTFRHGGEGGGYPSLGRMPKRQPQARGKFSATIGPRRSKRSKTSQNAPHGRVPKRRPNWQGKIIGASAPCNRPPKSRDSPRGRMPERQPKLRGKSFVAIGWRRTKCPQNCKNPPRGRTSKRQPNARRKIVGASISCNRPRDGKEPSHGRQAKPWGKIFATTGPRRAQRSQACQNLSQGRNISPITLKEISAFPTKSPI